MAQTNAERQRAYRARRQELRERYGDQQVRSVRVPTVVWREVDARVRAKNTDLNTWLTRVLVAQFPGVLEEK